MFSRHFRPFFRSYRQGWRAFSSHFWRFVAEPGFIDRCSLKRVATLLPLVIIRSAHCKSKSIEDHEGKRTSRRRSMSKVMYEMSLEGKAQRYLNDLKERWNQLHRTPGLFAYQLKNLPQRRRIPGSHGFYTELNTDRSLKRRGPQTIESLNPAFRPTNFNFNKVNASEVLMTIDDCHGSPEVQMIINKSPLTQYHTLICPEVSKNQVQRITRDVLAFCITFMRSIDDRNIRMGYNSPGALASVNHLHFHLLLLPQDLYIDKVKLETLAGDSIFRLSRRAPTEAICVVFRAKDTDDDVSEKIDQIYKLAMWMCQNNMPHNLFITQDRSAKGQGDVQVFIFARSKYCVSKDLADFNVGFCELAGFIPLPDADKMENLTEQQVLHRIRSVTGSAPKAVYEEITNIVEGRTTEFPWEQILAM
ncbi:GDP-D-glucose phosphorylase 1 [Drosophila kikkawai]|uniref:GDP-D-glucose phosphorylase 1 n=1 Tax=Drosophila kikkawai TaxID=30033 RepID=A0A6P4IYG7_DROKI|nr:GDP-D-glucose phosphorylase 1 [Drosophila kikkawai]